MRPASTIRIIIVLAMGLSVPMVACGGSILVHTVGASLALVPQSQVTPVPLGGSPEYRIPRDGTVQNMRILVHQNSYNANAVVTLRVNGIGRLTATIPAGSTADIDVAGRVSVVDGDRISVVLDRSAPTAGVIQLSVSYEGA